MTTAQSTIPGTITEPPRAFVDRFRELEAREGLPPAVLEWVDAFVTSSGRTLSVLVFVDRRPCTRCVGTGPLALSHAADVVFAGTRSRR